MNSILLHPSYFGSIAQYVAIAKSETLYFENWDNYQKQTLRNRTYIYGANGKLVLNLPVTHSQKGQRQLYRDVLIAHEFNTLNTHWKSLESAYRTSPYFEYYEDDLVSIFTGKPKYLIELNYKCLEFVFESLQLKLNYSKTEEFIMFPKDKTDLRYLSNAKDTYIGSDFEKYIQVFESKHGFLPNLSILDLLFNEGPNALNYLEKQEFNF